MKIIYTNISPVTKAYTNLHHIFYLKKHKPQKVYLCVWDNFVFEHPVFEKDSSQENRANKLKENVEIIEKLMNHLKIDYKIIYLSEAMNRLFKNSAYLKEFQNVLSTIRLEKLETGEDLEYIPFKMMSISKINYTIADYLVASYLPELFPEICSSSPNFYLTSERFKVFSSTINHYSKINFFKHYPPKPIYVSGVPVIIHPEKEIIPSIEMSLESIKSIVSSCYTKIPKEKETEDMIDVLSNVLKKLSYKEKEYTRERISSVISNASNREYIDFVSINLYNYFNELMKLTSKVELKEKKKSLLITSFKEFDKSLRSLNEIKIQILKNCNGKNTSLDISKLTSLKLSTVSSYLTQLKNNGLLTSAKKPERKVDSFVLDLEVLK
jgi:predicted transcriptional regulator